MAFAITEGRSGLALTSLTSDKASPQSVGTPIRFTAAATGGTAPYEYKWRLFDGATWSVAQTCSSTASLLWTPTAPGSAYRVEVWARSASNSTDAAETSSASATRWFTIVAPAATPIQLTSLTANKTAPQTTGTAIGFVAT